MHSEVTGQFDPLSPSESPCGTLSSYMASGIPAPLIRSGPWLLPGNNTEGGAEGVSPAPQGHVGFCSVSTYMPFPFLTPSWVLLVTSPFNISVNPLDFTFQMDPTTWLPLQSEPLPSFTTATPLVPASTFALTVCSPCNKQTHFSQCKSDQGPLCVLVTTLHVSFSSLRTQLILLWASQTRLS